jgi:hypothetical protein
MTAEATDFERLLREALDHATAKAPQANKDLVRLASEAADAVSKVTEGAATLELVPIDVGEDPRTTYQLQLRRNKSEAPASDLGVFRLSETGYPIHRWASRRNWEARPESPDDEHININDLQGNFNWMLSKPDSKLVVLVNSLHRRETVK